MEHFATGQINFVVNPYPAFIVLSPTL